MRQNEPCDNCFILPLCLKNQVTAAGICDILHEYIIKQTGILDKDLKPNKKVSFVYGNVYYIIEKIYKVKSFNASLRVVRYLNRKGPSPVKEVYFYKGNHPLYNELEWDGKGYTK
jgi:hypothetical protein